MMRISGNPKPNIAFHPSVRGKESGARSKESRLGKEREDMMFSIPVFKHLAPYSSLLTWFQNIIKEDPTKLKEKCLDLFYDTKR